MPARRKAPPETWAILRSVGLIDKYGNLPEWVDEVLVGAQGIYIIKKPEKWWRK